MTFRRVAAALLLALVALGSTALPASAHTELKSSNPAKGAALPAPPQQVELTFTESVTAPADAITVTGPNGAKWTVGQATVAGPVVTAPVQATGPAGTYTIVHGDDTETLELPTPGAMLFDPRGRSICDPSLTR